MASTSTTRFLDYGWVGGGLDARGYIPIFRDRTSRSAKPVHSPEDQRWQPDSVLQSGIWADAFVRGFRDYRFRANNMLMFSAEFRQTVAIKEDRGIDVFVFGDTGQVWGDNRLCDTTR